MKRDTGWIEQREESGCDTGMAKASADPLETPEAVISFQVFHTETREPSLYTHTQGLVVGYWLPVGGGMTLVQKTLFS